MICILEFGIFGLLRHDMNFTIKTLKSFLESLLKSVGTKPTYSLFSAWVVSVFLQECEIRKRAHVKPVHVLLGDDGLLCPPVFKLINIV